MPACYCSRVCFSLTYSFYQPLTFTVILYTHLSHSIFIFAMLMCYSTKETSPNVFKQKYIKFFYPESFSSSNLEYLKILITQIISEQIQNNRTATGKTVLNPLDLLASLQHVAQNTGRLMKWILCWVCGLTCDQWRDAVPSLYNYIFTISACAFFAFLPFQLSIFVICFTLSRW